MITSSFTSVYTGSAAVGNALGGVICAALGFRLMSTAMAVRGASLHAGCGCWQSGARDYCVSIVAHLIPSLTLTLINW